MKTFSSIEDKLKYAILNKKKIKFKMEGTPVDNYYLFHPYALIIDKFNDETSMIGKIEKDYMPSQEMDNTSKRITFSSILEIIIEEENFDPENNWKDELKNLIITYVASVE